MFAPISPSKLLRRSLLLSVSTLIALPVLAQTATAAADEQDIIVTATKRSSTLQNVPFSINAQTAADIQRSGATTLEDISRNVAGLTVVNLGPGQSQVAIRGVSAGQIVRDQPGVKEQVGIYLDESVISLSLFTPDIDLFDLNRVETLRGPQGTLFGSGSVGGTIRYITNQPKLDKTEGAVEADLNVIDGGSVGGSLKGAVNVPLVEGKVSARAVGYFTQYGGYIDALRPGGLIDKNVNSGQRYGGRLSLLLQPSENVKITPRILYQVVDTDGFNREEVFNLFANPFTTTRAPVTFADRQQFLLLPEKFRDETLIADATIEADLGPVSLTSVTSYTDRDILVSRDASALTGSVSVDLGFPAAAVALPSNLLDTTKVKSFTQEARLASTGTEAFQWVLGGFYAHTDRKYAQRLPTPGYDAFTDATLGAGTSAAVANGFPANSPFNSDLPYTLEQYSAFGEASYKISRLTLTAGLRYYNYKESRTITSGGLFANGDTGTRDQTKSDGFNPRFLASLALNDNLTINAQAAKGFRLGGVNDPLNANLCTAGDRAIFGSFQRYQDESLWNYEGGIKARAGGLHFNAAVFYTDIKNLQATLDAGSCSSRISFNVPKAHTFGVEFELTAKPVDGLSLGISGSILEAKFDSTVRDGAGAILGGLAKGNRLATVPNFQISANASYEFALTDATNLVLTASAQHVGSRYTQPSDQVNNPRSFVSGLPFGGATGANATIVNLLLPAYQLVNISAAVEFADDLSFTAYVNNVFDENAKLSFDRERGGRARLGFNTNQPRTFGVTVRKGF